MGMKVFTGNANPQLANSICEELQIPLGRAEVRKFSDGETFVEVEENVRGHDVFIVQPTCAPVNETLMELLILIDAFKRSSAERITAVIPYYGYARQDRKVAPRVPISAKLVADLLTAAGAGRIMSMDLHAGQIQGFFDIPFDHLFALPVLLDTLNDLSSKGPMVIVTPDAGGTERARAYAKRLNASLVLIDKRREKANVSEVMNVIGEVSGKIAVIVDDIVDTAGTMTQAVPVLLEKGAKEVYAIASHPVLSGPALKRISGSQLKKLIVTDSIPLTDEAQALGRIEVRSVANLLAEAIRRTHSSDSISSLFV